MSEDPPDRVHFVLTGPPRSGKTLALRALIGDHLNDGYDVMVFSGAPEELTNPSPDADRWVTLVTDDLPDVLTTVARLVVYRADQAHTGAGGLIVYRLLLVLDDPDPAALTEQQGGHLAVILDQGPAVDVTVALATSHPLDAFPPSVRRTLQTRARFVTTPILPGMAWADTDTGPELVLTGPIDWTQYTDTQIPPLDQPPLFGGTASGKTYGDTGRRYLQQRKTLAAATAWFDEEYRDGVSVAIERHDDGSLRLQMQYPPDPASSGSRTHG